MISKILFAAFICLVGVCAKTDKEAVERHCKTPPRDGMLDKDWAFNGAPSAGWYVPVFGKDVKKILSNAVSQLVHTDDGDTRDIRLFCPRIFWYSESSFISYKGLKSAFNCNSESDKFSFLHCVRNVTASTDNSKEGAANLFITLTDNQTYFFFLRCWEDGHNDWAVLSSTKTLSESALELIFDEVQSIGFDKNEYYKMDYDNCEDK